VAVGFSPTRDNRHAFVEQHLKGCDFLSVPLEPRTLGVHHLEQFLMGHFDKWEFSQMPAEEADSASTPGPVAHEG
jgi:hypothetical protein